MSDTDSVAVALIEKQIGIALVMNQTELQKVLARLRSDIIQFHESNVPSTHST